MTMTAWPVSEPVAPTQGVYAVAREVAALLEPDETMRDSAYARPTTYAPGRLYVWPRREEYVVADMNPTYREDFTLRVALAAQAAHEVDVRDPAVTMLLEAWSDQLIRIVREHPSGATFDDLRPAAVDYESLVSLDVRGFYLDLAGYRLRSD